MLYVNKSLDLAKRKRLKEMEGSKEKVLVS